MLREGNLGRAGAIWGNEVAHAATVAVVSCLAIFHEYFLYGKVFLTDTDG